MARNFDTVANINGEKEIWRLIVRITDVWKIVNSKEETHLELVVMDAKGDKIQVVVPKEDTNTWINRVREQMICKLENFSAQPNDFKYKACDHSYKILLTPTTLLKEYSSEVPADDFKFKSFGDILNGKYRADVLVDVIGAVHEIIYSKTNAAQKMVSLRLMDLSGNIVACTLWEDYSTKFLAAYHGRESTSAPFILVIKYARIRPTDGTFPVTVSNTYNYSKLFLNEQIPAIQQFKERLTPDEVLQLATQTQTQLSGGTQFSDLDRFKYKALPISLTNIKQLYQNTTCTTVMTTGRLVLNKYGWSYHGCGICRKGVKPLGQLFVCDDGHQNEAPVPRYRVLVRCKDNTGAEYNFLFWDQDSEEMIECSALALVKKMEAEGEDDPMSYPADLDNILQRTMAVRVKVEPRNRQASVMRYSEKKEWIQHLLEVIGTEENTSQDPKHLAICSQNLSIQTPSTPIDKCKSLMTVDINLNSQSLSATADHDPDNVPTLTPAKRLNDDSCSIDLMSPENLSAKFSSTTKPVIIKTEKP